MTKLLFSARLSLLTFLFFSVFFSTTLAQNNEQIASEITQTNEMNHARCATASKTENQKRYTLEFVDKQETSRSSGTTFLPVRIHIVTLDNGSGGISMGDVNIGLSYLNSMYKQADIEFYICSQNIINSTAWYTFDSSEEDAMVNAHSVYDAINMYFVDEIDSNGFDACGYAYYPNNFAGSLNILMRNSCTVGEVNGTIVHELGHFFDLAHTHDGTEEGNLDSNAEHVPRSGANSNCATRGDLLCDTDADPNGSNDSSCNFINDGEDSQDVFGNTYAPNLDNIMSYYSDYCGGSAFTAGQYGRIINGMTTRMGHSAYDLDGCAPNVVADPSGLTATINSSYGVDLSWTDNAGNELGYIIQKSLDGGTTWDPIIGGGVGPNVTSFTDPDVEANTTYSYRVRASNDDCNDYSATETITVGLVYCIPSHQSNSCAANPGGTLGVAIYSFEFQEDGTNLIDNPNNGCNGPLSIFSSTHSAAVAAGETYDVNLNFQNGGSGGFFNQFVTIWVDNNQNGDFTDAGEMLYQASTADGPNVNASILIPATILAGTTTLRVRTQHSSGSAVSDPCGYLPFSETEDYELVVTNSLPVSLTDFSAKLNTNEVLLSWRTETELNNDYFLIERSVDGRNFEKIGTVQGNGSSFEILSYELIDTKPAVGTNYYRLTQFDYDGSFEKIGRILSVEYDANQVVSVQPNPVQGDQLQLVYETLDTGPLVIQIFDITGKLMMDLNFNTIEKSNTFDIQLEDFSQGVYVLKTIQYGKTQSLNFVKTGF